jgi:PadR family transcriptional regulator PadR
LEFIDKSRLSGVRKASGMEEDTAAANWLKEMRKGYIRIIVLTLLSKKPYHGYEVMKEVKEKTKGILRYTSGGIYRILQDLEESKYIKGEWDTQKRRKRKIYRITDAGMIVLERALTKENQLANSMHDLFREYLTGVLEVRLRPDQTPRAPSLFSMFLEARTGKPKDSINVLREKNAEIQEMIKKLQKLQRNIKHRIATVESEKLTEQE